LIPAKIFVLGGSDDAMEFSMMFEDVLTVIFEFDFDDDSSES
jgi:hypothetical protein